MFYFFPGNYMWSQAVLRLLYTGGSVGEVARVVAALQQAAVDYGTDRWFRCWADLGDHLWRQGELELAADHPKSARDYFFRASCYYQWAVAFLDHHDPLRHRTHQQSVDAFARFASLADPQIDRVEVPYEGTSFPGWFVPGHSPEVRRPTVVFLPGLDSTKEQGYCFARSVARRGMNVLLVDGPGVGEALLFRGLVNRHDYEVPVAADYEYLLSRPDVDPGRVVVVGLSLGGYRAARAAAFEHRLAGCVAWGAVWDYSSVWERQRQDQRGAVSTTQSHMLHVMGARNLDEVGEKLRSWRLDGVARQIRCPMLILHGQDDAQIPVQHAYRLYEECGSPHKELKVFTEEEGGSAHCQNDNRLLAHAYIADWLEDTLIKGRLRQGIIVGNTQQH